MLALAKQRLGLVASLQGYTYYFGTLGYKQAALGIELISELCFGKRSKYLNARLL
jgi:1,4-dihydroxy-2-naphthoate octaprenyltransferase